ncbi:MAG: hypothetical protein V9F46_10425 [Chitinophagaceae bacterium]
MKNKFLIIVSLLLTVITITSCTSQRKTGCPMASDNSRFRG